MSHQDNIKQICDLINGGYNNNNFYNDYKLMPVMLFAVFDNSSIQLQPWFCYICGNYTESSTAKYGLKKIICTDKNHEEINKKHELMFISHKNKKFV